ncbi:MAG: PLP-dependent aminotransferase family protein [Lachnospiraceae bacterium]|nr:PLP-dependent aminotransferase family protein [Lachnospiraceae bacterium]
MKKNKSMYLSIYEHIRDDIVAGVYGKNSKLPSKRNMADEYGVSVITVEHAYDLLAEEGYILSKERKGYFVIYSADSFFEVASKDEERKNMIPEVKNTSKQERDNYSKYSGRFDNNEISFPQFARMTRRVLSIYGEKITERSPGFGLEYFRTVLAAYLHRSRRIEVDYSRIIIGSGAEYLYKMIVNVLGRDIVYGIENPSYEKIAYVYKSEGVKCKLLNLGNDGIDSNALWKADVGALHITPYRSYPSGVTASASKKHEYLRWCNERNAIIIEDDFESEFSPSRRPEETVFYLNHGRNVIYVNTFTKTIGSFIRVAYMVIPENLVKLFIEKLSYCACTVPTPEQYMIAELIESGEFERHINRVRRRKREEQSGLSYK